MKTELLIFVGSVFVGLACSVSCSGNCDCPEGPTPLDPQGPFSKDFSVRYWGSDGNDEPGVVQTKEGSLEITDSAVLINYVQDGVSHHVEYEIVAPSGD